MIRAATHNDWNEVQDLIHTFNDKHYHIPVVDEKLAAWFDLHLSNGVILLAANGIISGMMITDPVRDWYVLAETAWYAEDRTGFHLLRRFIAYGKENRVDEVRMTTLNTTPARAIALLQRMGFEEIERSHRLIL